MALKDFEEHVKRNFGEEMEHEDLEIPFPGIVNSEEAGIDCDFLVLISEQVKEIFRPVVEEIVGLVKAQVAKVQAQGEYVSAVVLARGSGQSHYLHSKLKLHLEKHNPPAYQASARASAPSPIENMQPINAWTAVVRESVLRGFEHSIVTEYKSRYHYGKKPCSVFVEDLNPSDSKCRDEVSGIFRYDVGVKWYIQTGDVFSAERRIG